MKYLFMVLIYAFLQPSQDALGQYKPTLTFTQDSLPDPMEEVIISSQKHAQPRKYTAQTIQIISSQQLQNLQARTTADVIAATGVAFVQKSQQGGGSITLRGFEANRNLLVIDGIRMNNLIYRGGHLQNIITIDNQSLERIEILQGPASTMYGSDALGGAVCMYTLSPVFSADKKSTFVTASTRYSSVNNEFTHHANFRYSSSQWATVTSVTHSTFGDLKSGRNQNPFYDKLYGLRPYYMDRINGIDSLMKNEKPYVQKQSGYSQYDFMQKVAFKPSDKITHGLNIQFSNSGDVPRYDRLTDVSGNTLKYAEWYYGPQKRLLTAYTNDINTGYRLLGNLRSTVYFQDIEESRHTRRFNNDALQSRIEHVQTAGASIDMSVKDNCQEFNWGVDMQTGSVKSTAQQKNIRTENNTPLDTRYPDGKNRMHSAGMYYAHIRHFNEHTLLNSGMRVGLSQLQSSIADTSFFRLPYQNIQQRNTVYSGNVGLVHMPNNQLKLSALVSSGYRVPNVDDLAKVFESAPGKLIVPNEKIKPERTITYELGLEKKQGKKGYVEMRIYYTDFVDAIVTDKFSWNGADSVMYNGTKSIVLANQNKRRAYVYGIQAQWQEYISKNFRFNLSGMYTYGRIKTDSADAPLDHIPPLVIRAAWTYETKRLGAEFIVDYNGKKQLEDYMLNGEDNEQYATPDGMPAWLTANLHVRFKVSQYVSIYTGIDNIFDTQYRTFASGINAPGRNLFATVKFSR